MTNQQTYVALRETRLKLTTDEVATLHSIASRYTSILYMMSRHKTTSD